MLDNFKKAEICQNILDMTNDGEIFKLAAEMRYNYIHAGWLDQYGVVTMLNNIDTEPDVDVLIKVFDACSRAWFNEVCDGDADLYHSYCDQLEGSNYSIDEIEYAASVFGRYLTDETLLRTLYEQFADLAGVPSPAGVLNTGYAARNLAYLCEACLADRPWSDDLFRVYAPFDGAIPSGISCPEHSAAYEHWTARQVPDSWADMPQYEWEENLPVHESMNHREVAYA